MKISFLLLVVLLLSTSCKKDKDKYIAKVNGEGIDRANFNKITDQRLDQIEKFGRKVTPTQAYTFKTSLMENLIKETALLQEAKKLKISIKDETVNEKLDSIRSRYPNKEDFDKILKQQKLTETDLFDMFKKQLIIEELLKKAVTEKIQIDDAKLKEYYDANKKQFDIPLQVQASHILLKSNETKDEKKSSSNDDKDLKAKLESIRKDIIAKKITFEDAAKKYSDCPSKEKGGDLGLFSKGRMVKEFEDIAFNSKPEEISRPFKSPFGYHIIKVTKKENAKTKSFEEAKDEIRSRLTRQEGSEETKEFIDKLVKEAKVVKFLEAPKQMETEEKNPSENQNETNKPAKEADEENKPKDK